MFFLSRFRKWWTSQSRDVFVYWDGAKWRRADPIRIGTRLDAECPNYLELLGQVTTVLSKIPIGKLRDEAAIAQNTAAKILAAASLRIFDLKSLTDDDGLTDGESLGVLAQFFLFMEDLARSAKSFMTSSSPTESSPTA